MNEKKILIMEFITEDECNYECDNVLFDCKFCGSFEECYMKACERCNADFAESIEYGGYSTEEDFWEQFD